MPAVPKLEKLPAEVRAQLHRRLFDSRHGDTYAIADWLTDLGYPIRKSAIGAYSMRHREQIDQEGRALQNAVGAGGLQREDTRLRILEVSAVLHVLDGASACPSRSGAVLENANKLLSWVEGKESNSP